MVTAIAEEFIELIDDVTGKVVRCRKFVAPPVNPEWPLYFTNAARETPDEVGGLKCDFLRDKAADRKAEHIDFRQSQRLDEGHRVGAHFLERSGQPLQRNWIRRRC
jgi:hypothetical protein